MPASYPPAGGEAKASPGAGLRRLAGQAHEVGGLEAGPPNQAPIDLRLAHELVDVLGGHAATIEDSYLISEVLAVLLRHQFPNETDRLVGLGAAGGPPVPIAQTGS